MARTGILYSDVATAAAQLIEEGRNPTVDSIREAIGGTGSKSTIAPFLKRWKEEHQGAVSRGAPGLPPSLIQAVKGVYDGIQADFSRKMDEANEAHRAELHTADIERKNLRDANATLASEKTELAAALKDAVDENGLLTSDNQAMKIALAGTQSEMEGLRQRLSDRNTEVAGLNEQLTQTRTQFEHYQEAAAARRMDERQAAEQRIVRLEQDLTSTRQQLSLQQANAAQHAGELSQLAAENARLRAAAETMRQQLTELRSEREQLAYRVKELSADREDLQATHATLQQELNLGRTALAVQQKEITLLSERVARAESDSAALIKEKMAAMQENASLQVELRQYLKRQAGLEK